MISLIIATAFVAAVYLFLHLPKFGKLPSGDRLVRIKSSPNYKMGQFQNISYTPALKEGVSYYTVMKDFFLNKSKRTKPSTTLPSKKTDLFNIDPNKNILVWFGHSSYYMQVDGKRILVDPVFSGSASPIAFTTRSFAGSDVYTADEIPALDYLFISHDHWDHLDHQTVNKLKTKTRRIITGLGTGAHFERWGFDTSLVAEMDWHEEIKLPEGFTVNSVPARHFSGRGFKRNQAMWMAFILTTPSMKIFIGGDSGYDPYFATIGNEFGPFDIAVLECGQYNDYWHYIHMMPDEVVQAALDLKAKKFLPVH